MNILVSGFPHGGTTIVRKVIGNHPDVFDYTNESKVFPSTELPNVVIKYPNFNLLFKNKQEFKRNYNKASVVLVLKDFRDIFVSMCLRFDKPINLDTVDKLTYGDHDLTFSAYLEFLDLWLDLKNEDNVFCVRYEDLFDNDYAKVKEIFNFIGINYIPRVVLDNQNFKKTIHCNYIPTQEPKRICQAEFRTYQTNLPFRNMSKNNRHLLPKDVEKKIISCRKFSKIYN